MFFGELFKKIHIPWFIRPLGRYLCGYRTLYSIVSSLIENDLNPKETLSAEEQNEPCGQILFPKSSMNCQSQS